MRTSPSNYTLITVRIGPSRLTTKKSVILFKFQIFLVFTNTNWFFNKPLSTYVQWSGSVQAPFVQLSHDATIWSRLILDMIKTYLFNYVTTHWLRKYEIYSRMSQKAPNHPSWQLHWLAIVQFPLTQPGKVRHSSQEFPVLKCFIDFVINLNLAIIKNC